MIIYGDGSVRHYGPMLENLAGTTEAALVCIGWAGRRFQVDYDYLKVTDTVTGDEIRIPADLVVAPDPVQPYTGQAPFGPLRLGLNHSDPEPGIYGWEVLRWQRAINEAFGRYMEANPDLFFKFFAGALDDAAKLARQRRAYC